MILWLCEFNRYLMNPLTLPSVKNTDSLKRFALAEGYLWLEVWKHFRIKLTALGCFDWSETLNLKYSSGDEESIKLSKIYLKH